MIVVPYIRLLPPPNPSPFTGDGTNTYLLGESDIVVVDPGPDMPDHVEAIIQMAHDNEGSISAILVTHAHSDHLAASYQLQERTGAPIYAHKDVPGVNCIVQSSDVLKFTDCEVEAHETPGHADEHICYLIRKDRVLFSGDLISGTGSVLLSESPDALGEYVSSLKQMKQLRPSAILPGHGPRIDNPVERINHLLDHREKRSQQILGFISRTPQSIDELVSHMYSDTSAELLPLARRNVKAHLDMLLANRSVSFDGHRWSTKSPGR